VLAYLGQANLQRLALERIAWRMRERAIWPADSLRCDSACAFRPTLAVVLAVPRRRRRGVREYLRWSDAFVAACGHTSTRRC
jgi:hypothetical protein